MSANLRLLTEEESANIAEVTIDTIRKYRDCGLLDPIMKDNQTFFQELDIRTLFYTKFKDHNPILAIRSEPEKKESTPISRPPVNEPAPVAAAPEPVLETVTPEFVEKHDINTSSEAEEVETATQHSLPPSAEMLELNKSLRLQIQILREERDWLRERIERLEARSEREQMLLLTQNENVRTLIKTQSKGFFARALPFFSK